MMKNHLLPALLFISINAHAQFMQAEAVFSSKSVRLKTLLLDPEKGIVAASATVTQGACSGHIAGIGKINGRTLLLEPYVKAESHEQCVLQVSFDQKWTKGKVEGKNCAAYLGTSCGWEGQEVYRKTP
ncbi:hypothetical protein [Pseudoduganella violacea]|uniref:Uncharacterized protein n=1 Tax=Pseudoduganella violacea TaxID=1715466 RepID=A0A7W5B8E2_9BURK|nr:hypothetical protein [Pseudoduganella violacea]MBB3117705.1 hypothetical protein [Pseudoduganella violacea]